MTWAAITLLLPAHAPEPLARALAPLAEGQARDLVARGLLAVPLVLGGAGARRRAWFLPACVAAALALGGLASARHLGRPPATAPAPLAPSVRHEVTGAAGLRLTARPRPGRWGWSAPARLLAWRPRERGAGSGPHGGRPRPGDGVLLRGRGSPPPGGAVMVGWLRLRVPRRAPVDGAFDEARWLAGRGLHWSARPVAGHALQRVPAADPLAALGRAIARTQAAARERLAASLPPPEASLLSSVLLGGGGDSTAREAFARLGLAHLFALSGLHVGIVAGLLLVALRPWGPGPGLVAALLTGGLGAFGLLVDLPGSVVRAVSLATAAAAIRACGRPVDSLRLLGLLLWGTAMWQPAALGDVGVRLSYLAAGGIVAGQRLLTPRVSGQPRWRRALARAAAVPVCAQLATLPVVAATFGVLPLAALPANVLAVPLFGVAVGLGAAGLAASAVWTWAGEGLLAVSWLLLRPLAAAASLAGPVAATASVGLPVWGMGRLLAHVGLTGALALAVHRGGVRAAVAGPLVLVAVVGVAAGWPQRAAPGPVVQQFAVGQGDCALIRLPDGWTALVDTGPAWWSGSSPLQRQVIPALRRQGIRRLDAVVLTHGHADHTGGAAALAAAGVAVGRWWTGGRAGQELPVPAACPRRPRRLHAAGRWALDLLPGHDAPGAGENDRSLAVALCRDDTLRALWTGDREAAGEATLVPGLPPRPAAGGDLWQAGHHGSRTSGSPALLAALRPRRVMVSCGVASRHGHPGHPGYRDASILRTDLHGTITAWWDGGGRCHWRGLHRTPGPPP